MKAGYYIGTGALENYYTLRYRFEEPIWTKTERGAVCSGMALRDYHVRNLSIDRETAIAKARELTGAALDADFEVLPIGERRDIDWSVFQGGKYAGRSIHEVAEIDREYLVWVCENLATSTNYAKTVELAKALVAHELAEREAARESEKAAKEALKAKRKEALAPLADALADGRGGFCDSVAHDLRNGDLPSGRGLDITLEILAKRAGRRGSKAFEAEYDRLSELVESLEA